MLLPPYVICYAICRATNAKPRVNRRASQDRHSFVASFRRVPQRMPAHGHRRWDETAVIVVDRLSSGTAAICTRAQPPGPASAASCCSTTLLAGGRGTAPATARSQAGSSESLRLRAWSRPTRNPAKRVTAPAPPSDTALPPSLPTTLRRRTPATLIQRKVTITGQRARAHRWPAPETNPAAAGLKLRIVSGRKPVTRPGRCENRGRARCSARDSLRCSLFCRPTDRSAAPRRRRDAHPRAAPVSLR